MNELERIEIAKKEYSQYGKVFTNMGDTEQKHPFFRKSDSQIDFYVDSYEDYRANGFEKREITEIKSIVEIHNIKLPQQQQPRYWETKPLTIGDIMPRELRVIAGC